MRSSELARLRERYGFRCGYCGISETDTGSLLTTDHFQPVSRGGDDTPQNRVYCCHTCNEFKGYWWNPEGERRVLHPLDDPVTDHVFEADDGTLRSRTPTGAFHIAHLRLNRTQLVAHRLQKREQEWVATAVAEALPRLRHLEDTVTELAAVVEQLRQLKSEPE